MQNVRTLSFLKTDIRGFTVRSGEISSGELDALLTEHRTLTETVVARFGGAVFKEMGDSFLVVFPSATAAVRAGITLQRELTVTQAGLGDQQRIEVRATVSTGDVIEQEGDYFGTAVNLAARMEGVTPAGEVYVSGLTRQALHDPEIEMELVDNFGFKGIEDPVPVYRAVFKHETRSVTNVAIMFSDIMRFSSFANSHDKAQVEALLDFWESAHRRVLLAHDGDLRLVLGDVCLMTFPDVARALAAAEKLSEEVRERNADPGNDPVQFAVGVEIGDLHIYRTAIFGPSANRADFAREVALHSRLHELEAESLVMLTDAAYRSLEPDLQGRFEAVDRDRENLARRMENRAIKGLWKSWPG